MGGSVPVINRIVIAVVFYSLGLFLRTFCRLTIRGEENIPPGGGVVFLSNHISALDVIFVPWVIYRFRPHDRQFSAAKEELFRNPILGWLFRRMGAFPVRRGAADRSAIRRLAEVIRRDKLVLYPEGTRSRDGGLGRGNRMVGKILRDTRPVVVPIAVKGTDRVIPLGKFFPRIGVQVEVTIGPPLDLEAEYAVENPKESSIRVIDRVMAAIAGLLGQEEPGAPARGRLSAEPGR